MEIEELKYNLKKMIIDECEKEDMEPEDIANDVEIFSPQSGLELDSVDALQISMALQTNFGIRVGDPKDFRRIVTTIDNLAAFVNEHDASK